MGQPHDTVVEEVIYRYRVLEAEAWLTIEDPLAKEAAALRCCDVFSTSKNRTQGWIGSSAELTVAAAGVKWKCDRAVDVIGRQLGFLEQEIDDPRWEPCMRVQIVIAQAQLNDFSETNRIWAYLQTLYENKKPLYGVQPVAKAVQLQQGSVERDCLNEVYQHFEEEFRRENHQEGMKKPAWSPAPVSNMIDKDLEAELVHVAWTLELANQPALAAFTRFVVFRSKPLSVGREGRSEWTDHGLPIIRFLAESASMAPHLHPVDWQKRLLFVLQDRAQQDRDHSSSSWRDQLHYVNFLRSDAAVDPAVWSDSDEERSRKILPWQNVWKALEEPPPANELLLSRRASGLHEERTRRFRLILLRVEVVLAFASARAFVEKQALLLRAAQQFACAVDLANQILRPVAGEPKGVEGDDTDAGAQKTKLLSEDEEVDTRLVEEKHFPDVGCRTFWAVAEGFRRCGLNKWAKHWFDAGSDFAARFAISRIWKKRFRRARSEVGSDAVEEAGDASRFLVVEETFAIPANDAGNLDGALDSLLESVLRAGLAVGRNEQTVDVKHQSTTNTVAFPTPKRRRTNSGEAFRGTTDSKIISVSTNSCSWATLPVRLRESLFMGDARASKTLAKRLSQLLHVLWERGELAASGNKQSASSSSRDKLDRVLLLLAPYCSSARASALLSEVRLLEAEFSQASPTAPDLLPPWSFVERSVLNRSVSERRHLYPRVDVELANVFGDTTFAALTPTMQESASSSASVQQKCPRLCFAHMMVRRVDHAGAGEEVLYLVIHEPGSQRISTLRVPLIRSLCNVVMEMQTALIDNKRAVKAASASPGTGTTHSNEAKLRFWEDRRAVDEKIGDRITAMQQCLPPDALSLLVGEDRFDTSPLLLFLDDDGPLAAAPLEHIPLLRQQNRQSVTRCLAPNLLHRALQQRRYARTSLRSVGQRPSSSEGCSSDGFYVLNPNADAEVHDRRLLPVLTKLRWTGTVGCRPSREDLMGKLASRDVFLFSGHYGGEDLVSAEQLERGGGGAGGAGSAAADERVFSPMDVDSSPPSALEQTQNSVFSPEKRRAPFSPEQVADENVVTQKPLALSLLMGCSSARHYRFGAISQGFSTPHHYLIGGAPGVVGTLWDVLSGEIDRFTAAALDDWSSGNGPSRSSPGRGKGGAASSSGDTELGGSKCGAEKTYLSSSLSRAQGHCRLPHLTGCAVVKYGLPI